MNDADAGELRTAIRGRYARTATGGAGGCCESGCCGSKDPATADELALKVGYSLKELQQMPEGANMGLGCGNPQAIAALKPGEVVVDLGSGGGFDCFLAAR